MLWEHTLAWTNTPLPGGQPQAPTSTLPQAAPALPSASCRAAPGDSADSRQGVEVGWERCFGGGWPSWVDNGPHTHPMFDLLASPSNRHPGSTLPLSYSYGDSVWGH